MDKGNSCYTSRLLFPTTVQSITSFSTPEIFVPHAKAHHTPRQSPSSPSEAHLTLKAFIPAFIIAVLGVIGWYTIIEPMEPITSHKSSATPPDFSVIHLPTMTTHTVVARKSEEKEGSAEEVLEKRRNVFAQEYVLDPRWSTYSHHLRGCISLRFIEGLEPTYADALLTCVSLFPDDDPN